MNIFWGVLMAIIGLFMLVCGTMKSDIFVYRLLVARSRILWGDAVHRFFQVSGVIVAVLGILWASIPSGASFGTPVASARAYVGFAATTTGELFPRESGSCPKRR